MKTTFRKNRFPLTEMESIKKQVIASAEAKHIELYMHNYLVVKDNIEKMIHEIEEEFPEFKNNKENLK